MLLFRQYTFGELYELITKQVIMTGGMESQHAETFLAFLLVDVITPIRDLTAIRHFQMGHKKVVIALQEFDPTGKCYGIGADTHFHNQGGNFAPVFEYYMSNDITDDPYCILENATKIKLKKIEFSTLLSRTMVSGGVAFVANEIPGQVQQLVNSPNKQQYTVGLAICRELSIKYPGIYDSLINQCIVRRINWSQHQRDEFNTPQRAKIARECKPKWVAPSQPIVVKQKRKRKLAPSEDSESSEPHILSEYEQLRAKNIQRNNERLRSLGLLN